MAEIVVHTMDMEIAALDTLLNEWVSQQVLQWNIHGFLCRQQTLRLHKQNLDRTWDLEYSTCFTTSIEVHYTSLPVASRSLCVGTSTFHNSWIIFKCLKGYRTWIGLILKTTGPRFTNCSLCYRVLWYRRERIGTFSHKLTCSSNDNSG